MNLKRLAAAGPGLVALFLIGCGASDGLNRGGELSGKVLLDGKPVGGGRVEIFSDDGKNSVSCAIRPDGTYTLAGPPLGPCKVTVKTSQLKGMPPVPRGNNRHAPQGASAGMIYPEDVGLVYTPIPAKYEDLSTTNLTVKVERGKQEHDLTLSAKQ